MLSYGDKNVHTNLEDMILASVADHYFFSSHILLPFPQIILIALFIKEKKKSASLSSTTHCSATTMDLGKTEQHSLFPLIDKYIPVPQNIGVCIITHCKYQPALLLCPPGQLTYKSMKWEGC